MEGKKGCIILNLSCLVQLFGGDNLHQIQNNTSPSPPMHFPSTKLNDIITKCDN